MLVSLSSLTTLSWVNFYSVMGLNILPIITFNIVHIVVTKDHFVWIPSIWTTWSKYIGVARCTKTQSSLVHDPAFLCCFRVRHLSSASSVKMQMRLNMRTSQVFSTGCMIRYGKSQVTQFSRKICALLRIGFERETSYLARTFLIISPTYQL